MQPELIGQAGISIITTHDLLDKDRVSEIFGSIKTLSLFHTSLLPKLAELWKTLSTDSDVSSAFLNHVRILLPRRLLSYRPGFFPS